MLAPAGEARAAAVRLRVLAISKTRRWRHGTTDISGQDDDFFFFWKAYLPIENTLNGKRPRIGP